MSSTIKIGLTVTALTVTAAIGYVAYFDYRRRNDVEFRRKISLSKRQVQEAEAAQLKAKED